MSECRHPNIQPVDPWPEPAWACDACGQPFGPVWPALAAEDEADAAGLDPVLGLAFFAGAGLV